MSKSIKNQEAILSKMGIDQLNPMQIEAQLAIESNREVVLLSPTGTGKTLAFLLPIIKTLDENCDEIQALIVVPSRELALQIEQVMRNMGTGYKVNAVYGGRAGSKDRIEIKHRPAVLIGTPGRVADHLRREEFDISEIKTLVLDEFDKSLEIGFEDDMEAILDVLDHIDKKILTSATNSEEIPEFVQLKKPKIIDYSKIGVNQLTIKKVVSPLKNKLPTLLQLLGHIGDQNGIVFCSFKDTIKEVSDFLDENGVSHGTFFGGMEQMERERALIKFRNGTHRILLATDLAARGIDVPELKFIIHYHLPPKEDEFTHRNGRTARMNSDGIAYVLVVADDRTPFYLGDLPIEKLTKSEVPNSPDWQTLYITGGRKDKISKGDIAGLFFKQGKLGKDELGIIELKHDCAFVSVKTSSIDQLLPKVNNMRLKKKKVRVSKI